MEVFQLHRAGRIAQEMMVVAMSQIVSPVTADTLFEQAMKLPAPERAELVQRLSDTLPSDSDLPALSAEFAAELDRRLAIDDADPKNYVTWEEVEKKLFSSGK